MASEERTRAIRVIKVLLFSASVIPALTAGAAAAYVGPVDVGALALATLGLLLAQAGGDYFYYYATHFHTDARDAHTKIFAGWRPFFADSLFEGERTRWAGALCLALAAAIGLYFVLTVGYVVAILALLGGAVALFFTPLMLRGYKEPVIFVTFGPLCMVGVYYVLRQEISLLPLWTSLPVACFVTVVGYLKSARYQVHEDAQGRAFVVNLDRRVIVALLGVGYGGLALGVALRQLPVWTLLGGASLPLARTVLRAVSDNRSEIQAYLWATVRAIGVLIIMGLGLALGFLLANV